MMLKVIKTILIGFLTFNLTLTSFAAEEEPVKDDTNQKAGEKIVITESVKPALKAKENPAESDKSGENKTPPKEEANKKEETKVTKPGESKKEETFYRESPEKLSEDKNARLEKEKKAEMEKLDKEVDELVKKLDKNSNLSKALAEVETSITKDEKASAKSK